MSKHRYGNRTVCANKKSIIYVGIFYHIPGKKEKILVRF